MDAMIHLIMAGLARWFVDIGLVKTRHYFYKEDLGRDDPARLPPGKVVCISITYEDNPKEE